MSPVDVTDEMITESLQALPRIEAPSGFNREVWNRIEAERSPKRRVWWLLPVLGTAMAVIIAAVPLIWMFGTGGDMQVSTPQIGTQTETATAPEIQPQPENADPVRATVAEEPLPVTETNEPGRSLAIANRTAGPVELTIPRRSVVILPDPGPEPTSIDRTVSPVRPPVVPRGMPTPGAESRVNPQNPDPVSPVQIREVLEMIGIEPEFVSGVWRARSVVPDSLAGRSGIVAGEVIEAIDNVPLTSGTEFKSGFAGQRLTVRRDGRSETVDLQKP